MKITYNQTHYYLLKCNDGYLLIDAGWSGKCKLFLTKLNSVGVHPHQIKYILLTHHHHDHTAIVQELREISGARLIIHRRQMPFITKGVTDGASLKQINSRVWLVDKLMSPFLTTGYDPITIKQTDHIIETERDNIILRKIGIMGVILSTPGHSSDSISVLLDNGTAYVGDLAMTIFGRLGRPPLPIEAEDYGQVKASLRKLIKYGMTECYPAHGHKIDRVMIETILG